MFEDDIIYPDDYVAEDTTETTEVTEQPTEEVETVEQTSETEETTEVEEVKEEPKKIKVKYLHEEKELTEDEAIPLIQKGMNHDRLQEQLNALKADPRIALIDRLAKDSGMTTEAYMQSIEDNMKAQAIQAIVDEKAKKGIEIDFDTAKELYEAKHPKQQPKEEPKVDEAQERVKRENAEFLAEYPNVKAEDIPKEVWEMVSKGTPLLRAYEKHETQQLKAKLKALEQNQINKQKAPVKAVTSHGSQEVAQEDDFLAGLLG